MARPKKDRIVTCKPGVSYFKPRGIPLTSLEEVSLTIEEREAIRLSDYLGMSHKEAGEKMGVSRATFGRILQEARKIIASALINGKAINVGGGNYKIEDEHDDDASAQRRCRCHDSQTQNPATQKK